MNFMGEPGVWNEDGLRKALDKMDPQLASHLEKFLRANKEAFLELAKK